MWFDINKLALNLEKQTIIFSNRRKSCDASINLEGIKIDRVKETKFLGVIVNENLRHINYTKMKMSNNCSVTQS